MDKLLKKKDIYYEEISSSDEEPEISSSDEEPEKDLGLSFQSKETKQRCEAIFRGVQCPRMTVAGPVCTQHASEIYGVEVKDSNIENAGRGLFATRRFRKKEIIEEYKGTIVIDEPSEDVLLPYAITTKTDVIIDASETTSCLVRFINGVREEKDANVFFEDYGIDQVRIRTTRPIKKGEELYAYYGTEYFKNDQPNNFNVISNGSNSSNSISTLTATTATTTTTTTTSTPIDTTATSETPGEKKERILKREYILISSDEDDE